MKKRVGRSIGVVLGGVGLLLLSVSSAFGADPSSPRTTAPVSPSADSEPDPGPLNLPPPLTGEEASKQLINELIDLARADIAGITERRRSLGFVSDTRTVEQAIRDWATRTVAVGPQPLVLTDVEQAAVDARSKLGGATQASLEDVVRLHPDSLSYVRGTASLQPLVVQVGVARDDATAIDALTKQLPPNSTLDVTRTAYSYAQVKLIDDRLQADWKAYTEGAADSTNIFEVLERSGVRVFDSILGVARDTPGLIVDVKAGATDEELIAAVRKLLPAETVNVPFRIQRSYGRTPASREQSPGQTNAGMLLSTGAVNCTSNVAITMPGGAVNLLTAAHCYRQDLNVCSIPGTNFTTSHDGLVLGTATGWVDNCSQGYDFARVPLSDPGMASNYALTTAINGGWSHHEITGVWPSNQTPVQSDNTCVEGASTNRESHGNAITLCANDFHIVVGSGFAQYTLPPGSQICTGDSGGLVWVNNLAVGVVHALDQAPGDPPGPCGRVVVYARFSLALTYYGASLYTGHTARLQSSNSSGQCIDGNWNPTYWNPFYMYDCQGSGHAPQTMSLEPTVNPSGNVYEIKHSGYCMDQNPNGAWNANVHHWACYGGTNQWWTVARMYGNGNNQPWLRYQNSWSAGCLDANYSSYNGMPLYSYPTCWQGSTQGWRLR